RECSRSQTNYGSCTPIANEESSVNVGRQVQFHMLPEDVGIFLQFAQDRDPVIVTLKSSNSPGIRTIANPLPETQVMTLWNQAILGSLSRKHIVYPGRAYYVIDRKSVV